MRLRPRTVHVSFHILSTLLSVLVVVPTLLSASCADCTSYSIKERHQVPDGWIYVRRAPLHSEIELQIGLKQSRFRELERHLSEVSDPSHLRYGQHLTAGEVNELITPSKNTLSLVEEWLYGHSITAEKIHYSPAFDWITLRVPISIAEDLLQTEYSEFWHKRSKLSAIRAPEWSLPEHLHAHIESVQPTSSFLSAPTFKMDSPRSLDANMDDTDDQSEVKDLNQLAEDFLGGPIESLDLDNLPGDLTVGQSCNASAVTPLCIRTLYGTLNYKAQASDRNAMALTNYNGQFNNRSDINLFLELYRPDAARAGVAFDFQTDDIAGATNQQSPATAAQLRRKVGREGNLDAQILLGSAFPTPLITYSTGGQAPAFKPDKYTPTNTNEPFLTWLHHVLAQKDLPQVIVTSYGDIEQTVPYSYAKRVCEGFAQLGARGVSVIFGAGDSGVGKPGYCHSNNATDAYEFLTSFPASCPYGTSVGATRNTEPEEIVAFNDRNGFVSGGGFSKYFPRPVYQDAHGVVDSYLSRLGKDKYKGLFNRGGRAYPDVAAQGYRRVMIWNGNKYLVDGTSASAPTFAAVIALVNDALIADGKPPLGFLNPWLYSTGFRAFTDVTTGSNKGCNTSGFHAARGWDPASGFGTPWFPRLKAMALEHRFRSQRPWYWPQS